MGLLCSAKMGGAQTTAGGVARKSGWHPLKTLCLLTLVGVFVFWVPLAEAQFAPIPLSGGTAVKMAADYQRPYIYVIQSPASGATNGALIFINATNGTLTKTLSIGSNPTDLTINVAEGRLYIASWGESATYVVDLTSQTLLPSLNLGTDIYKINAERAGRVITEGKDQFVYFNMVDTVGGTILNPNNYGGREGDGETDPTGTYYYHCDNNSSGARVYKFQVSADTFPTVATSPIHGFGSRNLLSSHNGNYLFWMGYLYDFNLNELGQFGSEIYACSSNGMVAFGSSQVFDSTLLLPMYSLPVSSTVMVVDGKDQRLWYCNSATNTVESLPLTIMQRPVILQQPANQTVFSGNRAFISVVAAGRSPLAYYWYSNGTNIAVTYTSQVVITNFQAANVGAYSVLVTNAYGSIQSSNAAVGVSYVAPVFTGQPADTTAVAGANTSFAASVIGSLPVSFQWQFNGSNINGATNATLLLSNLQLSNEGNYDVVASNAFGAVTSTNANLNVVDMAEALNTTNSIWTTFGDAQWFVQDNPAGGDPWGWGYSITHDGSSSMQSGNIAAGQQCILQGIISGPATATFWWQTESASFNDVLTVSLNGNLQASASYLTPWQQQTVYLGVGSNVLQWNYTTTDYYLNRAAAWVDQVNVISGGTPPFMVATQFNLIGFAGSNTTMSVTMSGTPPFNYQWQLNGTNIAGATNAALTLPNLQLANEGIYTVAAGNDFGATNIMTGYLDVVDLYEALNGTNLTWTTNGNALPWFPEGAVNRDGLAAAQSGTTTNGQMSGLQTIVTGPGFLTFWWNVDSYPLTDYLAFYINDTEQSRISSSPGWQQQNIYLGTGQQTLQWSYFKTDDNVSGQDAGWLEQVGFFPGATSPFITVNPTNQVVLLGSNVTLNATA
jgi:hypothetical protein